MLKLMLLLGQCRYVRVDNHRAESFTMQRTSVLCSGATGSAQQHVTIVVVCYAVVTDSV